MDLASTVTVERRCDQCGRSVYKRIDGVERRRGPTERIPRESGRGLYFDESVVGSRTIFRPRNTGYLLCTDAVRDFVVEQQWTNVDFLEVGEILDAASLKKLGNRHMKAPPSRYAKKPKRKPKRAKKKLPQTRDELTRYSIELERLEPDDVSRCPVTMAEVLKYLHAEGESVDEDDLTFVRTARIDDAEYWLWRFGDGGSECFVTVSKIKKATTIGYEEAVGLTPSQYVYGDRHHLF